MTTPTPARRRFLGLWLSLIATVGFSADVAKRKFDIPAGSAEQSLKTLSIQSGRQVLFPTDAVKGIRTKPVRGEVTAADALRRMLEGTRLVGVEDDKTGALTVRRDPAAAAAARDGADAGKAAPSNQSIDTVKKKVTQPPSSEPMKRPSLLRRITTALAVLAASAPAEAQTAPTGSAPTGETIELSPFVVDASRDVGYVASDTLAGSRLSTALRDTPAAISVLTTEFLEDIGAFELTEALAYAVNAELELGDSDEAESASGNGLVTRARPNIRIRGLSASTARNYFSWDLPTETALIERIEDSRGPNSVLFGIASPGGLLNANTKRALTGRTVRRASVTVGSFDSYRTTLDLNQPLLKGKAAIRFNAVYNKNNSFRHYQFQEQTRAHLAASYRLGPQTRLRAEFERGQVGGNTPRTFNVNGSVPVWDSLGRPTFVTVPDGATRTANSITQNPTAANQRRWTYIGNTGEMISMRGTLTTVGSNIVVLDPDFTDYSINVGGPGQNKTARFNAASAYLEQQISKTTFLEVAFNHQDSDRDSYDARPGGSNGLKGDPNQTLNTGQPNPFAGQLYLESNWVRRPSSSEKDTGRITLSQEFDAGKWGDYRFAALGEYSKEFGGGNNTTLIWVDAATGLPAQNTNTPENGQNLAWLRTYVTERDWATYHVASHEIVPQNVTDPVTGRTLSTKWVTLANRQPAEIYTTTKTVMVAGQARYFKGRLILAAGYRHDDVTEYQDGVMRDPVTREWIVARDPADADPSEGLAEWTHNVARTKTAGLMFHATPNLSFFYNQANNIGMPNKGRLVLPADGSPGDPIPVPQTKGEGEDIGFAMSLLDGRIHARATYYRTNGTRNSAVRPAVVESANTRIIDALLELGIISEEESALRRRLGNQSLFDHESDGVELQVTTNVTKNWRLQANYAQTNATQTNRALEWLAFEQNLHAYLKDLDAKTSGTDIYGFVTSAARTVAEELVFLREGTNGLADYTEASGRGKLGNRKHKVSLFTRYNFSSGWLKGAYVGGGYIHQSKMFVGLDEDLDKLYGNSYWYADAMAGYQLRMRNDRRVNFQLNIRNLFDKRDPLVTRYTADGNVQNHVVQPPITWRFTTAFDF